MTALLIIVATVCVVYDAYLTRRRIIEWGPAAELNPITNYLIKMLGLSNGVVGGILAPHILFSIFASSLPGMYLFYTGFLTKQFFMQLASLQTERIMREQRAKSNNKTNSQ